MAEPFDSEENTTPETLTIENGTQFQEDEAAAPISVPLGGPIYDPNFVGPLTTVPDFETSVFRLLQELKVELCLDSYSACEDISVDELKILGEDYLVNKALEEALKVDEETSNTLLPVEQHSSGAKNKDICGVPEDAGPRRSERRRKISTSAKGTSKKSGPVRRCTKDKSDKRRKENIGKLEVKLCLDSPSACKDISVYELKVLGQNDLVNKALEEASKVDEEASNTLLPVEQHSSGAMNKGICRVPEDACPSRSRKQRKTSPSVKGTSTISGPTKCSKEKIDKRRNRNIDDSYLLKVKILAKIKEKQDEDKAAVTLHSFNGTSTKNDFSATPLEILKKMTAIRLKNSRFKIKPSNFHEHIAVQDPEVILCVEVFHCTRPWVKTQEFMVLGGQTLTELRDKIYCVMDQSMQEAGQHDPSGYFMIEDVFCNDLRDPNAIDYSEPIFDWLKHSKEEAVKKWNCITAGDLRKKQKEVLGDVTSQLPQFRAFDMQKTRFCDLKFRLGANYLYCHQGDCKHTIVIRDMRLIHPEDVKNRAAYPLLTNKLKCRVRKCDACKIYLATRMTVDDKWAQENPCYFCETCYHCLHYDDDNMLMYTGFEEYKYVHE